MSGKPPKPPSPHKKLEKPPSLPAKTRDWTLPTVLGLILSVVGAVGVIELRPQLVVTPSAQLATNQPFSTPFEITNAGYLSIHVVNVIAVAPSVLYKTPPGGRISLTNTKMGNKEWDNFDLKRGESKTIVPYFFESYYGEPLKADMVISVDYRFMGIKLRWPFRFEGYYMNNWAWSKQPMGDLEPAINKTIDEALAQHAAATKAN